MIARLEMTMETTDMKKGPHGIALELVDRVLNLTELWDRLSEEIELEDWEKLHLYEPKSCMKTSLLVLALPSNNEFSRSFWSYSEPYLLSSFL